MKIKRARSSILIIALLALMQVGGLKQASADPDTTSWLQVARTRQLLKSEIQDKLLVQFTYDDLKAIAQMGEPAHQAVLEVDSMLNQKAVSVKDCVAQATSKIKARAEDKFRLKIILERTVAQARTMDEKRGDNPPEPY